MSENKIIGILPREHHLSLAETRNQAVNQSKPRLLTSISRNPQSKGSEPHLKVFIEIEPQSGPELCEVSISWVRGDTGQPTRNQPWLVMPQRCYMHLNQNKGMCPQSSCNPQNCDSQRGANKSKNDSTSLFLKRLNQGGVWRASLLRKFPSGGRKEWGSSLDLFCRLPKWCQDGRFSVVCRNSN